MYKDEAEMFPGAQSGRRDRDKKTPLITQCDQYNNKMYTKK